MDIQGPTSLKSYLQWGSLVDNPIHKDSNQLLNEAFNNNALFLNMNRNLLIINYLINLFYMNDKYHNKEGKGTRRKQSQCKEKTNKNHEVSSKIRYWIYEIRLGWWGLRGIIFREQARTLRINPFSTKNSKFKKLEGREYLPEGTTKY